MFFRSMLSWFFALTAVVAMGEAPAAASTIYFDATFSNADWTLYQETPSGTATGQQAVEGGGNLYRRVDHSNFVGIMYAFHLWNPAVADPAIDPIESLDWSVDQLAIQNLFDVGIAVHAALRQNGKNYYGPGGVSSDALAWATHAFAGLTPINFRTLADASDHPDFSITGLPIAFGFATLNDNVNNLGTRVAGFDNWNVTTYPVPEPATLVLTALGGLTLIGRRGRRAFQRR